MTRGLDNNSVKKGPAPTEKRHDHAHSPRRPRGRRGHDCASPLVAVPSAQAAAPLAGKQTAGWYRYKVGDIEVTVVTDGVNRFKFPDGFVTNKNRDEVNAGLASLYMGLEKDQIAIPYSPIAVNTGAKLVVIDTGTGEANFERSKGAAGQFHANLKACRHRRQAKSISSSSRTSMATTSTA